MTDNSISFESMGSDTLRTNAPYEAVFDHVRNIVTGNGGTLKNDDMASGLIEGAWKYGLNTFGIRVKIQFRTVSDNTIELHVKGGFADALDTTGAGKKKANEILSLILGYPQDKSSPMPPRIGDDHDLNRGKSKNVSGILALLLGGIGAHKFYLGNWGLGIIYLASLLIVPYISMIISIIESIRYFTMKELDFNEKYNYKEVKPFEVIW